MFAKVQITGTIEVVTGMHIGGSSAFSAIGAVDAPVIKDVKSGHPMIPGSSLKGKMRSLLAKRYNTTLAPTPDDDAECLTNLFGCSKGKIKTSKVLFSDMILSNWEELKKQGVTSKTEVKFENSIKRTTAVANPRQIERVIRGAEFPLDIIYEAYGDNAEKEMEKDFEILKEGFQLLEYDYLGGNGSRGYGKVRFHDLQADVVVGDVPDEIMDRCQVILDEV